MTNIVNHQITLAGRPVGLPKSSDWELAEAPVPDLEDGQVLVKVHYISVDPAMRGWMNDRDTYVPALKLGEVMRAFTVGEVIASQNSAFATGDLVAGIDGVQEYTVSDGSFLMKADTSLAPLTAYLNTLGIAGLTAYCGLIEVGAPKEGETTGSKFAHDRGGIGIGIAQSGIARENIFVTGKAGMSGPMGPYEAQQDVQIVKELGLEYIDLLLMHGADRATPVTVIENASRADQRVLSTTLNDLPRDLADAEMTGPALTFYGLAPRAAVQVATETPLEELA